MLSLFSHFFFVLQPVSQLEYLTKICVTTEIHEIIHIFSATHGSDVLVSCDTELGWLDRVVVGQVGKSRRETKQNRQTANRLMQTSGPLS